LQMTHRPQPREPQAVPTSYEESCHREIARRYAVELIALPLAELSAAEINARISAVIGGADGDIAQAALARAADIMKQRTAVAVRHAETLTAISRLAAATGCPDDTDVAAWLQGLGLIEPDGAGGYRLAARAALRTLPLRAIAKVETNQQRMGGKGQR